MTTSIRDQFEYKVEFSRKIGEIGYWVLAAVIGLGMFRLIFENFTDALVFVGIMLLWGSIVGWLWYKVGKFMSELLINRPLSRLDSTEDQPSWYLKYLIGDSIEKVFLQLETKNRELDSPKNVLNESKRIVIAFAAILVTVAKAITGASDSDPYTALLLSFLISTSVMMVYVPFSLIVEDARIMIEEENGTVRLAGGTIRNLLEGFFGITGIVSGYDLFTEEASGSILALVILYPFILGIFLVMAVPLLFPTLFVYFHRHENLVNQVREAALLNKIYPARTEAKRLNSTEIQELVFDEVLHQKRDNSILNKVSLFFKKSDDRNYTEEQKQQIKRLGGWICSKCQYPNSSIEMIKCEDCGAPQEN